MNVCVCVLWDCVSVLVGHAYDDDGHSSLCANVCDGLCGDGAVGVESVWEGDMSVVQGICVHASPCAERVLVPQGV